MSIVPCRYGDFSIPSDSDLIFDAMRLYGEWAQQEIDLLSRIIQTGWIVVDAGAFIGTHTRAFSSMVGDTGRVHAFEPNPASYSILLDNTKLSVNNNITTHMVALDAQQGTKSLIANQAKKNTGGTSLSSNKTQSSGSIISSRRLDDFNFEKVDFIKADVEGMEYSILLGAEKLIARDRPVLFLEVNELEASAPILSWAKTADYVVLGILTKAFNSSNFNESGENTFGSAMECGVLMVHEENFLHIEDSLTGLDFHLINTLDSLSVLLRCKPQYLSEAFLHNLMPISLARKTEESLITLQVELTNSLQRTEQAKLEAEKIAHSYLAEVLKLQAQLVATEEIAHSHFADVLKLQTQLIATEEAKFTAEKWAHAHSAEVVRLQAQKTKVESSVGYKLLAAARLTPNVRDTDA